MDSNKWVEENQAFVDAVIDIIHQYYPDIPSSAIIGMLWFCVSMSVKNDS